VASEKLVTLESYVSFGEVMLWHDHQKPAAAFLHVMYWAFIFRSGRPLRATFWDVGCAESSELLTMISNRLVAGSTPSSACAAVDLTPACTDSGLRFGDNLHNGNNPTTARH
jgi:hypothetical protein